MKTMIKVSPKKHSLREFRTKSDSQVCVVKVVNSYPLIYYFNSGFITRQTATKKQRRLLKADKLCMPTLAIILSQLYVRLEYTISR